MKKTVIILMFVTIISKILGFARDITLSYFYGASSISDIYLISLTIPGIIFSIVGKGISVGYIPMYTRIENKNGTEKASLYTNNLINLLLVISTIIFLIGFFFTETIVKLFASGFEGETLALTIQFTKISLASVYFTALIYVYLAFLQIKGAFIIPAIMGLPANIITIGAIFLSSYSNLYVLSIGILVSTFSQLLLLFIFSYKKQYQYKFMLDYKDENIRKMAVLALPAIVGTSVAQVNLLIDRTLASQITNGGITALDYANTLSVVIIGVFVLSISTVLYPNISKLIAEDKIDHMKSMFSNAINIINILVVPAAIGCMFFARPIVELLYGRGQFDAHAIDMTSYALFFYSIGIIGLSHRENLSNAFYALQDTKTPMINAGLAMSLNIILNLILSRILGIGGIALATSISTTFCSLLLLVSLRKKLGNLGLKKLSISFIKIIIAAIVMGGISKYIYDLLITKTGPIVTFCLSVMIGGLIYIAILFLLKVREMDMIVLLLKRKLKKSFVKKTA